MFQGSLRIVRVALDHFEMLEGAFDGFHFVWGTRVTPFFGSIPCFSDRKMTNLLSICNPAGFRNKAIRSLDVGLNLFVCWHIGSYSQTLGRPKKSLSRAPPRFSRFQSPSIPAVLGVSRNASFVEESRRDWLLAIRAGGKVYVHSSKDGVCR